ncbi:binding-protein-dependent transport systems inner membrane component [Thermotoga neapolitana DSM 4359]|uniref:Binding-protein-dependent transport systems inner membrane component n=1 Tax=Thermotoga neapolitana (strain ATCC 49049 / DSM 4359 / NBRC 107923 / NS-E) TaxID=309803 RepID=B9K9B6_THENN|nr:Binding-protein-dependent transport systems inner membrane component [Thermotoga neapolitana DSM 4359]HBF10566.1 sugar ABC transporter permease [Thermotoga neapolitana]
MCPQRRNIPVLTKRWWVPYVFLAVPLTLYFIWVISPIAQTIILSFTNWDGVSTKFDFIGWKNYTRLFSDPYFWLSLKNNIKWLVFFVIVAIPAGLGMAMLLDQKFPGNKIFKTLIYLPMTLSFVVIGQIWSWILEPRSGVLNEFLRAIGLGSLAKPWLSDPKIVTYALIMAALWRQIAYAMVLFLAGLKNVSTELVEAAYVDGANACQRFWYVILPALRPAMVIAITVNIIDSLRAFDIVYVMTRGGPFYSSSVLANYMYIQSFHNYRMGYGSAIAVIQFLITLGFIIVYLFYTLKREEESI